MTAYDSNLVNQDFAIVIFSTPLRSKSGGDSDRLRTMDLTILDETSVDVASDMS